MFRVGDKVIVTNSAVFNKDIKVGMIGEIVRIIENQINLKFIINEEIVFQITHVEENGYSEYMRPLNKEKIDENKLLGDD